MELRTTIATLLHAWRRSAWSGARQTMSSSPSEKTRNVFITGLPEAVRPLNFKSRIHSALKKYGVTRRQIKIGINSDGHSSGYAWASVGTDEQVLAVERDSRKGLVTIGEFRVRVERCFAKCDILFPHLTRAQRQQLRFDPVSLYSTVAQPDANRMSAVLAGIALCGRGKTPTVDEVCIVNPPPGSNTPGSAATNVANAQTAVGTTKKPLVDCHVVDAFACVGGNTISLAQTFKAVSAVELDASRHAMLRNNLGVVLGAHNTTTINADIVAVLDQQLTQGVDVAYMDPPWGGPSYGERDIISCFDVGHDSTGRPVTMRELILRFAERADLMALRLPHNFDVDSLARWVVRKDTIALPAHRSHERCHPFRLRFGSKTQLIILCFPRSRLARLGTQRVGTDAQRVDTGTQRVGLDYGLHNLDSIIAFLNAFNKRWTREHHPSFFDCDAGRWIRLNHWKGCKVA